MPKDSKMKRKRFIKLITISLLLIIIVGLYQKISVNSSTLYNPEKGDIRIVVISDLNSEYGSTDYETAIDKTIELMTVWQPDLIVCAGDMVAGQSLELNNYEIQSMWLAFDEHIAKPIRNARIPFAITIGNHDASGAKTPNGEYIFLKDRTIASEYWQNLVTNLNLDFLDYYQFPFYYTFKYQDIFFLVWDASFSQIPPQEMEWIERSLASQEAQSAKMRIVMGHLPLYGVSQGRDVPGEILNNSNTLRQILEKYQVHTYISGHHHAYYPAYIGNLQLLNAGVLGTGARALISGDFPPSQTVTIIDIDFDSEELTTYTTYNMETLEVIENNQLPEFLDSYNGRIWRNDIKPSNS